MFGLPEFGISEKLGVGSALQNLGVYKVKKSPMVFPIGAGIKQEQPKVPYNYSGYQPVSYSAPSSSSKKTTYPSQNYFRGETDSQSALKAQRDKEMKMISKEFESESKRLNKMESSVRSRYGEAEAQLKADLPVFLDQINKEKDARMTELGNTEIQRQQESKTALDQVRRLLGDLQRKNQAYLSATGNYGSSLPEAFGEQFGRMAFSSLGNVQSQRDNAMREITTKRQDVENFYSKKISEANQSYEEQINNLKSQFLSQLDAIDQSRSASSSAKRSSNIEAWRNYTNAKVQLDQQMQSYAQSVNAWRQQQNASLSELAQYQTGDVSNIDATDIYSSLGGAFASSNPKTEKARQSSYVRPKKGSLEDELMSQFPGLYGQYSQSDYSEDPYVTDEEGY